MCQKTFFDSKEKLVVNKSRLEGRISIGGAKNSALKLLTASILTDDAITIQNFPSTLIDIKIHIEMLKNLGKRCDVVSDQIIISTQKSLKEELNWEGQSIRNTLLIFGSLIARKGKAKVPLPGGCAIADRNYDLHQMVLEKLGAKVWVESSYLCGDIHCDLGTARCETGFPRPDRGNVLAFPVQLAVGSAGAADITLALAGRRFSLGCSGDRPG